MLSSASVVGAETAGRNLRGMIESGPAAGACRLPLEGAGIKRLMSFDIWHHAKARLIEDASR
jgi:hypothetical protein